MVSSLTAKPAAKTIQTGAQERLSPGVREAADAAAARAYRDTLRSARPAKAEHFDPEEIRRLVQLGKQRGLIHEAGEARKIAKDGRDVTEQHLALRSQWIEVTPERARAWLENNFRNRPLSDDVVRAYARDMTNGAWIATHQGIAFNDADELIDGQHRLHAIVLSGVTVRMMVTFGLPSKIEGKEMTTMDAVDRGRTRSVADQLKIQHGFRDAGITAAICASVASICCGERTRRLSVGQTLEVFRAYEEPIGRVIAVRAKAHGLRSAGVLAGFVFALAAEEKAGALFARLNDEGAQERLAPMGLLRSFLTSDEAKLFTPTLNRGLAELVLQAVWLELRGKTVAKLEMGTDGVEHFRKLQKERVAKIAGIFKLPGGAGK
jgi:hypothetical protein